MFKIEFYCEDKKVGEALWRLAGIAIGDPKATPVVNAKKGKNGALVARTPGRMIDLFAEFLKTSGDLTPSQIKTFCVNNGLSDKSYSNVMNNAIEGGLLKRFKVAGKPGKFFYRPTEKAKETA